MARVKTATEKITAFLKAKGLDAAEIKDAFAELDAADTDLDKVAGELTEYKNTNEKWAKEWYPTAVQEYQNLAAERDKMKSKIEALEKAGVKFSDEQKADLAQAGVGSASQAAYVSPDELKRFKSDLANASSAVMKQMVALSFKHFKKFNDQPDWDAIEKIMAEGKAASVEDGYRQWSKPIRDKRREERAQKQLDEGIKKGVQDALSKEGIVVRKKKTDKDTEGSILYDVDKQKDVAIPSKRELREAFMADLNNEEITH